MYRNSIGIRHLVCGSCNGCEHEMNALNTVFYDITQDGWDLVASPRHADVVTVTGPMTEAMHVVQAANERALKEYFPKPYAGHVTLFRAGERLDKTPIDPYLWWGGLVNGIEVRPVLGNHYSLIKEPCVQSLAASIRSAVDEIMARV